jgi:hypothetical protein
MGLLVISNINRHWSYIIMCCESNRYFSYNSACVEAGAERFSDDLMVTSTLSSSRAFAGEILTH